MSSLKETEDKINLSVNAKAKAKAKIDLKKAKTTKAQHGDIQKDGKNSLNIVKYEFKAIEELFKYIINEEILLKTLLDARKRLHLKKVSISHRIKRPTPEKLNWKRHDLYIKLNQDKEWIIHQPSKSEKYNPEYDFLEWPCAEKDQYAYLNHSNSKYLSVRKEIKKEKKKEIEKVKLTHSYTCEELATFKKIKEGEAEGHHFSLESAKIPGWYLCCIDNPLFDYTLCCEESPEKITYWSIQDDS